MTDKPPHIQRMIEEHRDLDERLNKLTQFIHYSKVFTDLPPVEQALLLQQQSAMNSYSNSLYLRLIHYRAI